MPRRPRLAERLARAARRRHAGRDGAAAAHVRIRVERAARPARRRGIRRRPSVLSRPTSSPRSPRTPAPRALVTTPFHLKALLESGLDAAAGRPRPVRHRAALAAARGPRRGAASARPCSRSTAAPRPARWRRGAPPPEPNGARSTAWRIAAATATAAVVERRPRAAADAARRRARGASSPQTLSPARPLQRPDQHRRQAQLARPPELPSQRDRRASSTARSGCRRKRRRRRRHRPPGRVRRRAAACAREQIVAALRDRVDAAFLPRRIVHGRGAAARGDRQAHRGRSRLAARTALQPRGAMRR